MRALRSNLALVGAYLRANLQAALEFRTSFASEVLAMLASDVMWLVFWLAFYERYPAVRGWGRAEIATLWAACATSVGLAWLVFGGTQRLAGMVERGELDFFLPAPRPVLLHALVSRMNLSSWGDLLFGWGTFFVLASPSAGDCALFALLSVSSAGLIVGFAVLAGSLAFWIDDAEGTSQLITNVMLSLASHPTPIFRGAVKLALFSVVPAAFLGFVPVELLRTHQVSWLLWHLGMSAAFVALGAWVFARGLRRHASGNLFTARL